MVYLDERKLRETLYKVAPYLDIEKEIIDGYVHIIMERAKKERPIVIDPRKHYEIKIGEETIVEFEDGFMYAGQWISPLHGELYFVGRVGYAKYEGGELHLRKYLKEKSRYVSRIQLIVRPREDGKVEIVNVGLNPIEVVEKPKDEYKKTLAMLLAILGGGLVLLALPTISQTALFTKTVNLTFALILFFIALALLLLFRRVSKTTYPRHKS